MWCYKRLLKVPWTEKKSNKEVKQMADVVEIVATTYEVETWVCWTHHERQPETFATTIPRGENRRKEKTEKAMIEQGGRCKEMVRVDKLWRYETQGREQRRMERHGCQPSDRSRHLIIIIL
ncbi:hypothetical protein ElyMa_001945400 [Elysia marginata]|uniref:Uncharacterized protein n=1 Tax=Elysia marginata TaxID=1093978 RepID=A0AAV4EXV8_9GAST|nr:hypothetical protein ElyMa_001945400 [Elysia marginata]